ncbi:hypothetical protein ACP70R_009990 [Stipagrostis hirtigluma subsp. patula]
MSIAMAALALAALMVPLPATAAVTVVGRRNCSASCGGVEISYDSYPFGIGSKCSLPGFNLTCLAGADNSSSLLLGNPNITLSYSGDDVGSLWVDYPFPTIFTFIKYFVKMIPGIHDYSIHWEAPGRPFAISGSSGMSLFIVGCGVKATLFISDSGAELGSCFVVCIEDQIMETLSLSYEEECVGIGCCRIPITVHLRAFTLNISRTDQSGRTLEQVKAFITESYYFWAPDLEADYPTSYPAKLSWAIAYQPNCKRAMEDKASYACVSNHSRCQEAPIGGYICRCLDGFSGNPYIANGCVREGNCSTRCDIYENGISYPFGIGPECSLPGFSLTCARSAGLLLLGNQVIALSERQLAVDQEPPSPTIITSIGYSLTVVAGVRDYSIHWEAPGKPFAIAGSSGMSLFVVGCGVEASLFIGDSSVEVGNCSVVCVEDQIMGRERPPEGQCDGFGCCYIKITVDLRAFTLNISRTGQSALVLEQVNAFITNQSDLNFGHGTLGRGYPAMLSWAIPYQPNCKRAVEDKASYACVADHSECQEASIGGYVCNCSEGSLAILTL